MRAGKLGAAGAAGCIKDLRQARLLIDVTAGQRFWRKTRRPDLDHRVLSLAEL